jgi:hypothetical protein
MKIIDQNLILLCNRSGKDRRTKGSFNIRSFLFSGRRSKIRRQADTNKIFYVDQFSQGLFILIVSILFLGVIDALLTLWLLNRGAYEVNPIMKYFLQIGPYTFFIFKYFLTVTSVIFLLIFRNVSIRGIRLKARSALYYILVFYLAVVAWEIHLISNWSNRPDIRPSPSVFTDRQMVCQVDTFNPYPISKGKIRI